MSDEPRDHHHDLVHQIARLGAERQGIQATRATVIARAREQLDSMPAAIQAAEDAVAADTADILGQRRLRTLLQERSRLERVIGAYHKRHDDAQNERTPQDLP